MHGGLKLSGPSLQGCGTLVQALQALVSGKAAKLGCLHVPLARQPDVGLQSPIGVLGDCAGIISFCEGESASRATMVSKDFKHGTAALTIPVA